MEQIFRKRHIITLIILLIIYIIICSLIFTSFSSLEQTEYGLLFNSLTAKIDKTHVYKGGFYFIGFLYNFRTFPASIKTITFINDEAIDAASGDKQSISLEVALQYKLIVSEIPIIYEKYQFGYENFFRNEILSRIKSDALKYGPEQYLNQRKTISNVMSSNIDNFLKNNGANLMYFLFLNIVYIINSKFELMTITLSSVFQNSVIEKVTTSINNIKTQNEQNATITRKKSQYILQEAQSIINVLLAEVENKGRILIQEAKTFGYLNAQNSTILGLKNIKEKLGLSDDDVLKYSWLRDLNYIVRNKTARIMAGFNSPGDKQLQDLIAAK